MGHLYSIHKYFFKLKKSSKNSSTNLKKDREILFTERYDDFVNSYFIKNQKMKNRLNSKEDLHFESMILKEANLKSKKLLNDTNNSEITPDKKISSKMNEKLISTDGNNNLECEKINEIN